MDWATYRWNVSVCSCILYFIFTRATTRCGESCVGIIGLHTMSAMPIAGDSAWQADTKSANDIAWWNRLKGDAGELNVNSTVVGSVWLTHPVFSNQTWVNSRERRLDSTLNVAQDLRKWLVKASQ